MEESDFDVASELRDEIEATYAGFGNPTVMVAALRRSVVAVAIDEHQIPLVADYGGLSWVLTFTSPTELAEYGMAQGRPDRPISFATLSGAALLDELLPSCTRPTGAAVDVAGVRPMAFPPVSGIVPEAAVPVRLRG